MVDAPNRSGDTAHAAVNKLNRIATFQLKVGREEFASILAQLAAGGLLNSGARVKRVIKAVDANMTTTTEAVFGAIRNFPGNAVINREVYGEDADRILRRHFENLVGAAPINPGAAFGPAVGHAADALVADVRAQLEGALEEFHAGLWTPVAGALPYPPAVHTGAIVHVGGDVHAPIQIAGDHASQSIAITIDKAAVEAAIATLELRLQSITDVHEEVREEIGADFQTIRAQLRKPTPRQAVLAAAGESLKALAFWCRRQPANAGSRAPAGAAAPVGMNATRRVKTFP